MSGSLTPAELRKLIAAADDLPDLSAAAWNTRRDANQVLANWRAWLPGLLDQIELHVAFPGIDGEMA